MIVVRRRSIITRVVLVVVEIYFSTIRGVEKIDEQSARTRANATRVIPDGLECGWVYVKEDVERRPRDDTRDHHPMYSWPHSQFHEWATAGHKSNPMTSGDDVAEFVICQ